MNAPRRNPLRRALGRRLHAIIDARVAEQLARASAASPAPAPVAPLSPVPSPAASRIPPALEVPSGAGRLYVPLELGADALPAAGDPELAALDAVLAGAGAFADLRAGVGFHVLRAVAALGDGAPVLAVEQRDRERMLLSANLARHDCGHVKVVSGLWPTLLETLGAMPPRIVVRGLRHAPDPQRVLADASRHDYRVERGEASDVLTLCR